MHVFLCADATGRYVWIRISGAIDKCISRIEDSGLEVVEEQTEDYIDSPVSEWEGTILLSQLSDSDAVLFP